MSVSHILEGIKLLHHKYLTVLDQPIYSMYLGTCVL